ncbi:phosphoinositide 3-kinase regulatory subunit 4 isoform X2 [Bacillus rossius redtenbacheri]
MEKRWIAFQILYALHQCHKVGICHGDIKLENIMITSWNWVLLTDFASFKPTYLPEDNPADFSYFFDTSRRRTCYIAPERFIKTLSSELSSQLILPEEALKKGDLTPGMDIFSAGCALMELFNEGHPPFDFSQLLAYRNGEYNVSKQLDRLEEPGIRELVRSMMQKDPSCRKSAELYLDEQRGRMFPEYFYSFMQSYMTIFSAGIILSPDEKIARLKKDIGYIIKILISGEAELDDGSCEKSVLEDQEKKTEDADDSGAEGLVIITSLVTSCIRGLRHCNSKFHCLDILLELAGHVSDETILDRILPYIFHFVHDPFPRVRVRAVHTLTKCLALVKNVPCSDANIFPEYVLPNLTPIAKDEVVIVRATYAENIAQLATTALRFLEQCQLQGGSPQPGYETELQTLQEIIQQMVSTLLTDAQNVVKQTLMENGITKLCVFFGKQKANDVLLSHMITFLNDKDDKQLRGSFFDCIVGVAAYVGWHSSPILMPLLQQGLTDTEEFVMMKAISAMTALTELGLLSKSDLYDLLEDTTCFLVHPNLWVRQAIVGFVSAVARVLNLVDVQCRVMATLQPYLEHPLIQANKEVLLLSALSAPVPRVVYASAVRCAEAELLLQVLRDRQRCRAEVRAGHVPQYTEPPASLRSLFRRLASEGMTDAVEDQLLAMSRHLLKIQKHNSNDNKNDGRKPDGVIELAMLSKRVSCHEVQLQPLNINKAEPSAAVLARRSHRPRRSLAPDAHAPAMNEEWQHMFGTSEPQSPAARLSDTGSLSPPGGSMVGDTHFSPQRNADMDHGAHERSYIQCRVAPCHLELRKLIQRKQELYGAAVKGREWAEQAAWQPSLPPQGWRLRGALVAHLHEHRGAVTRLVAVPDTPLFASSSADGCVRIWDCGKMEGRNIANRSRQTYSRQAGPLVGLTACEGGQSLASASHGGAVFVLRIEANSNKMSVINSRQLDIQEDGCAVDINYFDSGSQSVLVYATMYGSVVGWDLRSPGTAWKLDNYLKHGMTTSFCVNSRQNWLALGTSSGYHVCWDLRFQLPTTTFVHPSHVRVRKVICHPTEQSCVLVAYQGNNEVCVWNLETQFRQMVLWASGTPVLSYSQVSGQSVCGMYAGSCDRVPFLLAGGSDMRLRYWDLDAPGNSYLPVPAAGDSHTALLEYKSRLVDGTNVVEEVQVKPRPGAGGAGRLGAAARGGDESPRPGPDQPQAGHHDCITEVAMCQASQCFLLSGSRDGVIKVWK